MDKNVDSHDSLEVTYEPIELQSQIKYDKRSFVDRFKTANTLREQSNKKSDLIAGKLIIDVQLNRLLFKPSEIKFDDLLFYHKNFHSKYAIHFRAIKEILFFTQNNEYYLKAKDLPNKSFRAFSIYCHDFRVYNFNRHKLSKTESMKFYHGLAKSVFKCRKSTIPYFHWSTLDDARLVEIYKENIKDDIAVKFNLSNNSVVFIPEILYNENDNNNRILPQIAFHSENDSFIIVCNQPSSRSATEICHNIISALSRKDVRNRVIFYLSGDRNSDKYENLSPSNKDLNESFAKLYSICTSRNKTEFKRIDKKWRTKLSESGWLTLVNKCLQGVNHIVMKLKQLQFFVFLMESDCPIWSWFFVSLTQICLQPLSRTITGFLSLIKKNWILSNTFNSDDIRSHSLFLLFLDCVYQFLRLSPLYFEFNEEMLICIYDLFVTSPSVTVPIFDQNLNDVDWRRIFVNDVVDCFENQCYRTTAVPLDIPELECYDFECFWSKMFTRWIPYMQIESGGLSVRHYAMTYALQLEHLVHSNYPFSLNYDKITKYKESSFQEDARSNNFMMEE